MSKLHFNTLPHRQPIWPEDCMTKETLPYNDLKCCCHPVIFHPWVPFMPLVAYTTSLGSQVIALRRPDNKDPIFLSHSFSAEHPVCYSVPCSFGSLGPFPAPRRSFCLYGVWGTWLSAPRPLLAGGQGMVALPARSSLPGRRSLEWYHPFCPVKPTIASP